MGCYTHLCRDNVYATSDYKCCSGKWSEVTCKKCLKLRPKRKKRKNETKNRVLKHKY